MTTSGRSLLGELKDRKVFRTTAAYAVVAWLILQVGDVVLDSLPVPANTMTVLIALVGLGFPVTMLLAWRYEFTSDGIFRHGKPRTRVPFLAFLPLAGAIALALGVAAAYLWRAGLPGLQPEAPAVAVLPFSNLSAAPESDYFADGLTEEVQSVLVQLNAFRVTAPSSVRQVGDADLPPTEIGRRLGADLLLRGSVRRDGSRVRVTATLVDTESGFQSWSESYDRELADVFAIQVDIARNVAQALSVVISSAEADILADWGTSDMDAYDLYLRGLGVLRQPNSAENADQAEQLFRQAISRDGNFARAYAALCEAHLARYEYLSGTDSFEEAERACHRALTRDNESPQVRVALGRLYYNAGQYADAVGEFDAAMTRNANLVQAYVGRGEALARLGRPGEAEASFRKAMQLDPSYWGGFSAMGELLFDQGRFAEAANYFQEFANRMVESPKAYNNLAAAFYMAGDWEKAASAWDRSLEISPTRTTYLNTGTVYFFAGRMDLAAERYTQALILAPEDYRTWVNLGDAYFAQEGFRAEAEAAYRRGLELGEEALGVNPVDAEALSVTAHALARLGRRDAALRRIQEAMLAAPDDLGVNYYAAVVYSHLGEKELALRAVERAVTLNYERRLLGLDPGLSLLWDDPRFAKLAETPAADAGSADN
ncbi:MAG: tetratricopeptide repeat protein [Gammaproteobacteria bacterium]